MRKFALALVSVCALAACGPSTQTASTPEAPADGNVFPDLSGTSYRAEATLTNSDGASMPVVMVRDGGKMRLEINAPEGASTIITNGETGESFVITTHNGRQMAIRASGMDQSLTNPIDNWQGELADHNATRSGSCSVAGENGAEWTKTTTEDGTDTVCVTEDGIILRATDDGRVVWETTSVQRGTQNAALFTLPEGVQAVDLGNMGGMMNEALEAAKQRGN